MLVIYVVGKGDNMAAPIENKIKSFAFQSRYVILILQIIFNVLIPDHDAGAFNPPRPKDEESFILDNLVNMTLGGFIRWDGVYFLHISEYGYTYKNCLAFFPLFPFLVKFFANTVLIPLHYFLSYRLVLVVAAYVINQFMFIKTAILIYKLGQKVTQNELISYKAALLFCINPASIFMSAPYSETLFCYLTFLSMFKFEENSFSSAITIGFSFLTRANGIVTAGFKLQKKVRKMVRQVYVISKTLKDFSAICIGVWSLFSIQIFPLLMYLVTCLLPFAFYQYIIYQLHCEDDLNGVIPSHLSTYGEQHGYRTGDGKNSPWCNNTIPLSYSHIQSEIWNVGFLRYYEFKQIPNFILAAPVSLLSIWTICRYVKWNKTNFITLGLLTDSGAVNLKKDDKNIKTDLFQNTLLLPYIFHLLFLTVFSWLFIHIQIMTRMLFSSSPVLYWFAASVITMETKQQKEYNKWDIASYLENRDLVETKYNLQHKIRNVLVDQILNFKTQTLVTKFILMYFLGYMFVGTVLFCNFLPWT